MKFDIIQTSFAGGEFGPSLYGRTDIAQYANACQIVENFLIRPYGSAISAPGSRYVATVSDSTLRTHLAKFIFNRTDAYVLEMGDLYMRFFTNRGQVVTKAGTEDLSAYTANLIAHYKMNDNTNSTVVLDATTTRNGSASTLTQSLSTTAIVSNGFNLSGLYHISVPDDSAFTRTASSQPMTVACWVYYNPNGSAQCIFSKSGEYELSVDSSDLLSFYVTSGSADTKLLLHMDGADGATTFTDSSASSHTVTANGDAQIDTSQFKFGTGSGLFDGVGDFLSIPDSADWDFGTADFTIDFWWRPSNISSNHGIISDQSSVNSWLYLIWNNGGSRFDVNIESTAYQFPFSASINTWYHIALVRSGTNLMMFANGTQIGTTQSDSTDIQDANGVFIGKTADGLTTIGWLDEFRILKGTAAWDANFAVPTVPYQGAASNSWQVDTAISKGWHFVAIVFKGDGTSSADLKIYIDGMVAASTFYPDLSYTRMSDTASLFRIGTTSSAGAKIWKSKMDNLGFIQQELTANQIAALYSTSAYQLTTVFLENEVSSIQYTQLNDIIWMTHPNHPVQKLTRVSANEWTIADAAFKGGPFMDDNTDTTITITASSTTGTVNLTVTPTTTSLFTRSSSTLGHHNAYWMIGGLAQTNTTTGLQEMGYVQITNVVNSYTATATVIKNLKTTAATSVWAEGAWSAVRGYPSCCVFHERRLWFAGTTSEPQKIWGTKVFEYDNFALDTQADDDGLNLPLASNESNEIKWLLSGKSLFAGTFGGAFVINSKSTDTITPNNANASEEVGFGSDSIPPKKMGNFLYFIQKFRKKLREMFYNFDTDTFKAVDATILSPHILGDGAVDIDVAQNPDPLIYQVLTGGTLAILTRETDQQLTAWSRRSTAGTYNSIAVIPSQAYPYDEAWTIVTRFVNGSPKKCVEYFETVEIPDRQDLCLYLDSALTYNAYESTSTSNVTISLSASSGSVTLTSSTAYFNGGMTNKRIRAINSNGTTLGEGTITATNSTTSLTLSITTTFSALSYSAGLWGVSVSTVSGIGHLEGKTVGILADGITESLTRTVASGSLTLGSNYFVVSAGLSYDQKIFTLPKEAATERGTAQGKLQRFSEISFKLNKSTQNFKYGTDASNLDDINIAITPTVTTLYTGILPPQGGAIAMRGGYKRGAQIYIKNSNPLPMEILSIMGQLDTNEK